MSAHTPGPWAVRFSLGQGVVIGGPVIEFARGSGQQQVASTCGQDWMTADEQAANTRLIAAAPDLLAELERACLWTVAAGMDGTDCTEPEWVTAARAAITKARGGA